MGHSVHPRARQGAIGCEKTAVQQVVRARRLPFMAIRAVADPAGRAVPWCALAGLSADGRTRPLPVLGRLCLRPWELPALIALARETARALESLRRLSAEAADERGLCRAP